MWVSVYTRLFAVLAVLCLLSQQALAVSPSSGAGGQPAEQSRLVAEYAKLPMSFEANGGQAAAEVKFLARGPGYALFLKPDEAVLAFHKPDARKRHPAHPGRQPDQRIQDTHPAPATALTMRLVGASPEAEVTGLDELPGKANYLRGNDPRQWHTGIATYRKAKIRQAYPGIDLVYYGNPRQLEYDFVVAPGADPKQIQWAFDSLGHSLKSRPRIAGNGDIVLDTQAGEMRLRKPVLYQTIDGQRRAIEGRFQLRKAGKASKAGRSHHARSDRQAFQVGFAVGDYDSSQPLVIDPGVVFSTYLGGGGGAGDRGAGIAVDGAGNAYVTGYTDSADFPTANAKHPNYSGGVDAFVSKLSGDGQTVYYSTYLGGGSLDLAWGIAVDGAGNAYVTGQTYSADFPTANAKYPNYSGGVDAFVSKLSGDGQTVHYSTYLGGSSRDGGAGIAVDGAGNAYVTGSTASAGFPTANAQYPNLIAI